MATERTMVQGNDSNGIAPSILTVRMIMQGKVSHPSFICLFIISRLPTFFYAEHFDHLYLLPDNIEQCTV